MRFILLCLIISVCETLFSQRNININSATYHVDIKLVNTKSLPKSAILEFNSSEALFYFPEFPQETSYSSEGNAHSISYGDSDQNSVYTNLRDSTLIWKTNYGGSKEGNFWVILSDPAFEIEWNLIDSIKKNKFDSFSLLAKGTYFGRDYTAWYIPSIPTTFGPYKFHGLPGLIEEIRSSDDRVNFTLESISQIETKQLTPPKNGIYYSKEEHKEVIIKRLLMVEALSLKHEAIITNNDPDPNSQIEKGQWNYISEYKKKRSRRN